MVEEPKFGFSCEGNLGFGFAIKSKDEKFDTDYYYFAMQNAKGFNDEGSIEYYKLDEFRKEVSLDSINYKTISDLTKSKEWWQVHNELSLKKKIFLIEKKITIDYYHRKNDIVKYYILPMVYEGTRKNIVPTDLSVKKE